MDSALTKQMARTAGVFQLLVAIPTMVYLGGFVFFSVFDPSVTIYDFVAALFNALFSAGVVFIIFIQRKVELPRTLALYFETAKSTLASAVWIWLLADTIVGPSHWPYYPDTPRKPRIVRASISVLFPIFFYYPTLAFAMIDKRWHNENDDENVVGPERTHSDADGESEPLLRR